MHCDGEFLWGKICIFIDAWMHGLWMDITVVMGFVFLYLVDGCRILLSSS